MKLIVTLTVVALLSVSAFGCVQCAYSQKYGRYVCNGTLSGSCSEIDIDPPSCSTCGACAAFCIIPCFTPVQVTEGQVVEDAWRTWPWLTSTDFSANVGAVSPTLGQLVMVEQKHLRSGKCLISAARSGSFYIGREVKWNSTVNPRTGVLRYFVVSGYGTDPRELQITKDGWKILRRDVSIAEGTF